MYAIRRGKGYLICDENMLKTAYFSMQEFSNFIRDELEFTEFWGNVSRSFMQPQQLSI